MKSKCCFDLHLFYSQGSWTVLWPSVPLPLRIPCIGHVPISTLKCWFFGNWVFCVPYRFYMLVVYQMSTWQRFFSHSMGCLCVWWLVPLLCKSSLVWCSPLCLFFLLDAEPFEFCLGSHYLYISNPVCFLLLPGVVSQFQNFYYGLWPTLSWFWYKVKDRDLVSVFYMWISSFPSSICWRGCLFSIVCLGSFVEVQLAIAMWVYVWVFCSELLVFLSVFVSIPSSFCCCGSVV
jgi:hypothetical protein